MTSLRNRTVMVTGASSGIGEACARAFAAEGARLVLVARRKDRLTALVNELADGMDTEAIAVELDVRDAGAVDATLAALPAEWRAVDVLVNNAGLGLGLGKLHESDVAWWEQMIDTNVKGLLYITRAVLPGMVERNEGHIINTGSVAGHWAYPKGNVYGATKFAVNALSQGMKMDLLGLPIRVTSIDPGLVETEFSVVRFRGDEGRAKKVYEGLTPMTPDDIAEAMVWAATRPPHVNINNIIMMATDQSAPTMVHRK